MPLAQRYAPPISLFFFFCSFQPLACHDIFLILSCSVSPAVAGVRASRVADRLFKHQQELPLARGSEAGEEEKKGSERGKASAGPGSAPFTTDGYCLEFQGRDLMLRSLPLSRRRRGL